MACHRCGDDETVDHLFQCPGQQQWKADFLTRFATFLQDIDTDADIQQALTTGMSKWLNINSTTIRAPQSMNQAMQSQSELGWNLILCGLFDDTWCNIQEQHIHQKHSRRIDESGLAWNEKLCTWVIRESRQVWLTRNQEVHEPDDGHSKSEQALFEQIRRLYDLSDQISHQDRVILDEPIEEKLLRPTQVLQQWVRNTVPVITRCISDFQEKLNTGQRDIRQYFQREPPDQHSNSNPESGSTIPE